MSDKAESIEQTFLDALQLVADDGKQEVVDAALATARTADKQIKDLLEVIDEALDGGWSYETWAHWANAVLPIVQAYGYQEETISFG